MIGVWAEAQEITINFRKYFVKGKRIYPDKTGLSLSTDQWDLLVKNIQFMDRDVKKLQDDFRSTVRTQYPEYADTGNGFS